MIIDASKIRNFSIIAHIDHGKTTLTDRLIELSDNFEIFLKRTKIDRLTDSNPIERERGITIKLAMARLAYKDYILNLIDTPGHVDFNYEVSRSLAACEGALLIVDATQGIQAQTLTNYYKALALKLKIIPVINKIDLLSADIEKTTLELMETFNFSEKEILKVSAKTGLNISSIFPAIVEQIPPPKSEAKQILKAFIISAFYHQHKGAIALIKVVDGVLRKEELILLSNNASFTPLEIGFFTPIMQETDYLEAGMTGYVCTGFKNIRSLHIGDTLTQLKLKTQIKPVAFLTPPKSVVFMDIYPLDSADFERLKEAVLKLSYQDAALTYQNCYSLALGSGVRVGFLGILHCEVFLERIEQEFELEIIGSSPTVAYQVFLKSGQQQIIQNSSEFPAREQIDYIKEPLATIIIFSPEDYVYDLIALVEQKRGFLKQSQTQGVYHKLTVQMPFAELITDFHDKLKSISSGFASFNYSLDDYSLIDLEKIDILFNGEKIEALSFLSVTNNAEYEARLVVKKIKTTIKRQMFEIAVQAVIGGKIIARETVKPFAKDVTAKLYGGDRTRRMKLLHKQKEGKKRMRQFGKVSLNKEVFLAVLKKDI